VYNGELKRATMFRSILLGGLRPAPRPEVKTMHALRFFSLVLLFASAASAQNTNDPNQPYDPDAHTVALYHLDDGSGTVARDSGPNGLDATLIGATWTPEGRFELGLALDGDDHVSLPFSDRFTSDDLTLEAWVYATEVDRQIGAVVIDGWFSAVNGGGRQLGINAERRPYALARVALGPLSEAVATTLLPLGEWVHLAAVFDELNGRLRIVVNGVIEADEAMPPGTNAFHQLTVGRELLAPSGFISGKIDEVRVSDVVRELLPVPVRPATWGAIKATWHP
jgi:hypothetical protein